MRGLPVFAAALYWRVMKGRQFLISVMALLAVLLGVPTYGPTASAGTSPDQMQQTTAAMGMEAVSSMPQDCDLCLLDALQMENCRLVCSGVVASAPEGMIAPVVFRASHSWPATDAEFVGQSIEPDLRPPRLTSLA